MRPDACKWPQGQMSLMDYCIIFACLTWVTSASIIGDECDWTGSGLAASSSSRGVTPVYLRCTAGRIMWLYPRGALRILLRLPGQDGDFHACIKMRSVTDNNQPAARVFLEGPRSLLPLYSHTNDGSSKAMRCFQSKNGQAAIYVEAADGDSIQRRVAEIEYDLQILRRGTKVYDLTEECRPCTSEELSHAFCTSDLVARGIIHGVENSDELEISQMLIKVTKLIRHTTYDTESNSVDSDDSLKEITLQVAEHCGVAHGLGEFVFMARRKLGDLTLTCAPRLEDWAVLINSLSEGGKAHCLLKS